MIFIELYSKLAYLFFQQIVVANRETLSVVSFALLSLFSLQEMGAIGIRTPVA
jgi:hypothetical protein